MEAGARRVARVGIPISGWRHSVFCLLNLIQLVFIEICTALYNKDTSFLGHTAEIYSQKSMGETNTKKQSICLVSATPLSVYFFLKPHIAALAEQYNVTVVFDPRNDDYLGDLGLEARVVPIDMARKLNPFQDVISLFHLYQFFRKNHFDLIVSVAPKAGMLSMIVASLASNAKRVHIFQGEFWASKKGLLRFILKQADSLTANLAHQVLAVSVSEKKFLAQEEIINKIKPYL